MFLGTQYLVVWCVLLVHLILPLVTIMCEEVWKTKHIKAIHTHRMNLKKSSSAMYWQYLDKNFKQLMCSQGVYHVWESKQVISNIYSNMW